MPVRLKFPMCVLPLDKLMITIKKSVQQTGRCTASWKAYHPSLHEALTPTISRYMQTEV